MAATIRRAANQTRSTEKPKPKKGKGKAKEPAPSPQHLPSEPAESAWDWTALTDSLVSAMPPIFTKDGSYFFSLVGDSVRIHAVTTGKVVSTLTAPSSDVATTLTCAVLNPHNAFQLITGSNTGILAVWDFVGGTMLQTIDIAQPIHHICAHENFRDTVFVSASKPGRTGLKESRALVLSVSLKPADASSQSKTQKSSDITSVGKTRQTTGLAFSPSGSWLVATAGHKAYVASTTSLKSGFTKYVSPERLTCLAFHPSEDYFATGDDKGSIRIWYCLNEQLPLKTAGVEKKAQATLLHWHAHAVSSIAFTPNGAYLLSGGEESVLVIWQLHSGKREYLPRLGSPIKTISVAKSSSDRDEEYLLGLADATYSFVSAASLKVARTYSHQTRLLRASTYPLDAKSRPVIFSPLSGGLVSELEVSPSNRVSRRDEKPIEPCRVERIAVCPAGDWLASIDGRDGDEDVHGESYLKIWSRDHKAGFWILNTRIDRPHGLEKVTSLAFSPSQDGQAPSLATAGADGSVKTWRTQMVKQKTGVSEVFWIVRSSYNVQNGPPLLVSWSPDGSLLAVTLPRKVMLFAPSTNQPVHTLAYPECSRFESTNFVGKGGRYIAVAGETDVLLWDLVGLRVHWSHKCTQAISAVVTHPRQNTFAVVHQSTEASTSEVVLFDVTSPKATRTLALPFGIRSVVWYPLLLSFSLVGITHDWRVVVLGDKEHLPRSDSATSTELVEGSAPQRRTLFEAIFGKSAFTEAAPVATPAPAASWATGSKPFEAFTTAKTYFMPPLESLFDPLITSVLHPRDTAPAVLPPPEEDEHEMEVDAAPVLSAPIDRRLVDATELDLLTSLFQKHTLKARTPTTAPTSSRKRKSGHLNGSTPRTLNGSTPQTNGTTSTSASEAVSTSVPLVNGRKRKKSTV
ncbi:WD40 repeat-like protein [Mycena kentingensis (nom. inval.)]|nr:WD40 repeat-like protein [Mycena kentingensis (nom. inval.)]